MDSYSMIRVVAHDSEVVMTKRMPPGQIDPHIGSFKNDMLLADSEQQTLMHWIEAAPLATGPPALSTSLMA